MLLNLHNRIIHIYALCKVVSSQKLTKCVTGGTDFQGTSFLYFVDISRNTIVRLFHPRSRDSPGQKTFLAPSAEKQTGNYDTECSNQHGWGFLKIIEGGSRFSCKNGGTGRQSIYGGGGGGGYTREG